MKNHIIKITLIFFVAFLFNSCNDDFLERYPLDEISSETFWNSENDLAVYNNSLYNLARKDGNVPILMGHDEYWNSTHYSIWYLDFFSDNTGFKYSNRGYYLNVKAGIHTVPTDPQWYGYKGWDFVRAANVGLENYNTADIPQSVIDKYAGEARLFRGWFYADKVSKFGDASWVDQSLNIDSDELYAARTPRDEVMANVLEDLDFACEKLPDDWGDGNAPGRLNRWCALQVKSRVCLFEGTWQKYHGGTNGDMWLQEAADAAQELIENGPYSLYVTGDPYHDYNAFHGPIDISGNPEVLYWRKYQTGVCMNNIMSFHTRKNGGASRNLVEDYLCTDGLPITLSPLYQGDEVYENLFIDRDPRLRQTILHNDDLAFYMYEGSLAYDYPRVTGMSGGRKTETGYHIIKVYNYEDRYTSWDGGRCSAITLRLGEALLNYAEAKAELGTISQADLDMSINLLRDRVAMPHLDMSNVPVDPRYVNEGVSALIVEIRRERRIELFMEGFRYDDLRRWKQGNKLEATCYGMRWDEANRMAIDSAGEATVKTSFDPVSGIEYIDVYQGSDWANPVFDESKHYLWPIPLSTISQNPNIKQNPGW